MNTPVPYRIGVDVSCADGDCGRLDRVVIDPLASQVTHLVVDNRLVPVDLVEEPANGAPADTEGGIRLRCTLDRLDRLQPVEETDYLPGGTAGGPTPSGYRQEEALLLPYYGLGAGTVGLTPALLTPQAEPTVVAHDRIPAGEVQVRRGDRVEAADGPIGRVQGLVVDPRDHGVTHVLLQEGHLWGKKTVAIPIRETYWRGGLVNVRLTKAELAELPEVELASHT
ncbi:hypothetical protein LN042_02160 [Kitasatospora sp. RB6PN24]|uniref:hypothetical protein n=1 Tax=Kitasatospora humi TaxID=2893891 RepID=UPI001E4717E9|nr:hypothetical protein [Kitasatospora humi]MCC9305921.1 hypothetical protein [Kitasatospora humi]